MNVNTRVENTFSHRAGTIVRIFIVPDGREFVEVVFDRPFLAASGVVTSTVAPAAYFRAV